jgi:single-stranded DNA-binding protein
MCRDEKPQLKQVGENNKKVLELKLVPYWTPDNYSTPWIDLTLWEEKAEQYVNLVEHNQAVYLDADLQFRGYTTKTYDANGDEKVVNRTSPTIARINDFKLVNVIKPERSEETSAPSSIAETAKAAATVDPDDIPF